MKQIFTLLLLILVACSMNETKTLVGPEAAVLGAADCVIVTIPVIEPIKQDSKEIEAIKKILSSQQKCWNNGDINGFMQGYWKSEKLIFTSLNHKPTYGWKKTLERYKNSYPTKSSMGEFKFKILDLELTSKTTADLFGKWELIRDKDHPNGLFWLDLKKFDENWLITKDSSLSF